MTHHLASHLHHLATSLAPKHLHESPTSHLELQENPFVTSLITKPSPHFPELRVVSSPNHPTSNIEDAFSSTNSFDYILASPDYFPALPRNTSSDSSNNSSGLIPIASPTLSLFHDDPYMKVMHAYNAIIPPQVPIPPSIIVPQSPMLSPMFDPQDFFRPEEILPPKKRGRARSSSSTSVLP
ncbi:hypothetical protein Tco_0336604 [Tanacetum coccineum]